MTDTEPDELDLSPAESLIFWLVLLVSICIFGGFVAGVLYPYY